MTKIKTSSVIAFKIWLTTFLVLMLGAVFCAVLSDLLRFHEAALFLFFVFIAGSIIGLPALIVLFLLLWRIGENEQLSVPQKFKRLFGLLLIIALLYGIALTFLGPMLFDISWLLSFIAAIGVVFAASALAVYIHYKKIVQYFLSYQSLFKNLHVMQDEHNQKNASVDGSSSKNLTKGLITAGLILAMYIPTLFILSLVDEREHRHKDVVKEISSKWSLPQTISGPFIDLPYIARETDDKGKVTQYTRHLIILPEQLNVEGKISTEERPRSIYKALLFRSNLHMKGNFKFQLPKDIAVTDCIFSDAKIGMGLSDFKGIEEKPSIGFNNSMYELLPETGVPSANDTALTAPLQMDMSNIGITLPFDMNLKVRGSEFLHFLPYAANSGFVLQSDWQSPSFDGNTIPNDKEISAKGFTAKWLFSRANIPVGIVNKSLDLNNNQLAFGVTLLQPADQYAKTMRSVKYAILIIGLSFALFFIIELLQQKPFHPMQYVLVGIALSIFYTLLLSISEYILFSQAYLIAAGATVVLISMYAKAHFSNWKTASIFAFILSLLYGFIYVLISLENTALLVGSIGLFVVLALIMYSSRKINWYGNMAITNTSL